MAWQLEEQNAILNSNAFTSSFDLAQPYLGLRLRDADGKSAVEIEQLFAFLVPDSSVETYVRGVDLVAKYPPRNSDLVSYSTYYRLAEEKNGVDFILSAQTSLLDSNPLTQVTSSFGSADMVVMTESGFSNVAADTDFDTSNQLLAVLLRPADSDKSLILSLHPSDFYKATVRVAPKPRVAFWVFPSSLEKGVIRRASFQFRIVNRQGDEDAASKLLEMTRAAAPPLDT